MAASSSATSASENGLFLVTSSGGSFRDLVSGETVELDPSDQIRTLITLDLFEERTDALVSGRGAPDRSPRTPKARGGSSP